MVNKGEKRLHFSLIILGACLLFTFLLWDFYLNSDIPLNRTFTANLILTMGILFSISAGMFSWSLESRQTYLEKEMVRREADIKRKVKETKKAEVAAAAIYQSSHILFSHVNIEPLLKNVMELMQKVLQADEGSLMLMDERKQLYIAASRGISQEIVEQVHLSMGERVAGRAAHQKREFLIVDGLCSYEEFQGIEENPRIRSSIVCPLICQNEVLGVLNLNRISHPENYGVADLLNVSIFATIVAQALRNASLYETLEGKVQELESAYAKLKTIEEQLSSGA